jgi:alpha-N-arabinofuranosidase
MFGSVPTLDAVATRDGDTLAVFALNRGNAPADIELVLDGPGRWTSVAHSVLAADDAWAVNSASDPDAVTPRETVAPPVQADRLALTLPPLSWHCLRFAAA